MRSLVVLAALIAVGAFVVLTLALALDLPARAVSIGFAFGITWMVASSVIINTRNAALVVDEDDQIVWGGMDGLELHAEHMRRDRVRRHPEGPATFPAGDVA